MALDTAQKRSSAIRMGRPWMTGLPRPDGSIMAADREQVAFSYTGILSFAYTSVEMTGLVLVGRNLVGRVI